MVGASVTGLGLLQMERGVEPASVGHQWSPGADAGWVSHGPSASHGSGGTGDEGISLIEVLASLSVLLIVFVAVAVMLQAIFGILGSSNAKQVASTIASGIINQQRQNAANLNATGYLNSAGFNIATGTPAAWCTSSCSPITQTIQGVTYYAYVTGGWCEESSSGSWGNDNATDAYGVTTATGTYSAYPAYFVAVKVAWGPQAKQNNETGANGISTLNQVVTQSIITPSGGYGTSSPSSGEIGSCPVGNLK